MYRLSCIYQLYLDWKHLNPVSLFFSITQLQDEDPTLILKKGLVNIGVDPSPYAHKSWRIGMACAVLLNQAEVKGGKDGIFDAQSVMEYIEQNGRWTNSE